MRRAAPVSGRLVRYADRRRCETSRVGVGSLGRTRKTAALRDSVGFFLRTCASSCARQTDRARDKEGKEERVCVREKRNISLAPVPIQSRETRTKRMRLNATFSSAYYSSFSVEEINNS